MEKGIWSKKWFSVLVHAASWAIIFSLPYLLKPDRSVNDPEIFRKHQHEFSVLFFILRAYWVLLFYANAFILIPRFFHHRNYRLYVLSIIGAAFLLMGIDWLYLHISVPELVYSPFNFFAFNLFPLLFVLVCSWAYKLTIDRIEADKRDKDRVNENLKTELSLLRSQVSPHFMFNVLNNMVALARKKSDLLEPSLIKLSQLLRYMLYETHEKVPLLKEVEYLQSYIDLQQQRFGNAVDIHSRFDTGQGYHEIEPMLLIPFVENAFKHGAVMIEHPEIFIDMHLEGNTLHFSVRNKFRENSDEVKDKTSGIGLGNVRRRLNLLYPRHHHLNIRKEEEWFDVTLTIDLS